VYGAVSRIARSCAQVNFDVYQVRGEQKLAVDNHPAEQLLRHPSSWASQFNLVETTIANLQLTGNAYWFLNGPAGEQPNEVMNLRPDRMRVVATADSKIMVSGYVYTVEGVEVPLEAAEVIHFRRYHPSNLFYGLSPLEAAAVSVQADEGMARWQRGFFGRDVGIPAGAVVIKTPVDDDA
jgi:HK97 family phage portal protein